MPKQSSSRHRQTEARDECRLELGDQRRDQNDRNLQDCDHKNSVIPQYWSAAHCRQQRRGRRRRRGQRVARELWLRVRIRYWEISEGAPVVVWVDEMVANGIGCSEGASKLVF